MSLVFEDPPSVEGPGARFRERSEERKEMDELLTQLTGYADQWARLYDFPAEGKDDAEKMAGKVRNAATGLQTGKSWSVAVRPKGQGWSVFAKMSSQPARTRTKKSEAPAQPQANNSANEAEQAREPTFQ